MPNATLPLVAAALLGSTAAGATTSMHLPASLARLSADDFTRGTTIEAGQGGDVTIVSTRSASSREGPSRQVFIEDGHARAVTDRAGGRTRWEIWHEISHGGSLGEITQITYQVHGAQHSTRPRNVAQWQGYCSPADWGNGCLQFTRIGFELPEEHARAIAASHAPNSREPWLIRFEDRKGRTATVGFAPAELAGLVQAHDARRGAAIQSPLPVGTSPTAAAGPVR